MTALIVAVVWLAGAIIVGLAIGRMIRLADQAGPRPTDVGEATDPTRVQR